MKKLNLSSIGLTGAIIMFIIILCSCGTVKLTPRTKAIIGANAIGVAVYSIAGETKNPNKTRNIALASMATVSFTIAISEPKQHINRNWRKSLIRK